MDHYILSLFSSKKAIQFSVPFWNYWIIQVLVAIVYFHSGIGKLNEDWMIRGEPLTHWLLERNQKNFFCAVLTQIPNIGIVMR